MTDDTGWQYIAWSHHRSARPFSLGAGRRSILSRVAAAGFSYLVLSLFLGYVLFTALQEVDR